MPRRSRLLGMLENTILGDWDTDRMWIVGGRGGGAPSTRVGNQASPAASGASATEAIVTIYRSLRQGANPWVGMADLRDRLSAFSRGQVDDALMDLVRAGRLISIPEENQKTITSRDRAAAFRLGGEDNHMIAMNN